MKKVAFYTLGCKVNTYETQAVLEVFERNGYMEVEFKEVADVYIINTCTVTNSGDSKSRKMIRSAIRRNENAVVGVMGCYSQLNSNEILEIEGVDVVIGTDDRNQIFKLCEDALTDKKVHANIGNIGEVKEFDELQVFDFSHNRRAFLKIQDGCNNFCTYCIIPFARGRMRSRKKENVIEEATRLVENGFNEIVLTGIHTAGYGEDLENYSFYELLVDLSSIQGLKRIRISSIEASQITDNIIQLFKDNNKLASHIHIPLQSGSNSILKKMNRKYTTAEYFDKISKIRENVPNISITTDVIVGFPEESAEDFEEMYEFIKKTNFSELHVFPYSKRDGTIAAKMEQVSSNEKDKRVKKLLELSSVLKNDYVNTFIGETLEIIPEVYKNGKLIGHTSNYIKIEFDGCEELLGKNVEIIFTENIDGKNIGILKEG